MVLKEELVLESPRELVNKPAAWAPLPHIPVQQDHKAPENLVSNNSQDNAEAACPRTTHWVRWSSNPAEGSSRVQQPLCLLAFYVSLITGPLCQETSQHLTLGTRECLGPELIPDTHGCLKHQPGGPGATE